MIFYANSRERVIKTIEGLPEDTRGMRNFSTVIDFVRITNYIRAKCGDFVYKSMVESGIRCDKSGEHMSISPVRCLLFINSNQRILSQIII